MSGGAHSDEQAALRAERDNAIGGYKVTREAVDRFREVVAECLGYADVNPGDDALLAHLRTHFGKDGPEPTRWREFCTSALAALDQINTERRTLPNQPPDAPTPDTG